MSPRIHKLWPTWAVVVGLLLVFAGERILSGYSEQRVAVSALGGLTVLVAALVRIMEHGRMGEREKGVHRLLVLSTAGVVAALLLYAPIPLALTGEAHAKLRAVLWALWPIALACSIAPMIGIELAVAPVAQIDRYELRRVRRAFERGLGLGLLVSVMFLLNFLADRHDVKADLSFGQKTEASEGTRQVVRDLTKPVRVVLFFPRANEVAEVLEPYVDSLERLGDKLEIERVDQALSPQVATETGVTENGYVTLSSDKIHEKVRIGTKLRNAKSSLKTFDSSFAAALIKVTRPKSVAYFTAGHGERLLDSSAEDKRPNLASLKRQLKDNQYEVKPLGVAEGLGSEVPRDASLVFIIGPEKAFLPEEVRAIQDAIKRGVRFLIAADTDGEGEPLKEILATLGLELDKTVLVNDRAFVRVTQTDADRTFVYSNRYSSHASVTTMTRNSDRLATLFAKAGSISKLGAPPPNGHVDIVLNSLDGTFADKNGNLQLDAPDETRKAYGLAAAVTRTGTTGKDEMRAFVVSDADVFCEPYVRFQGNPYFIGDVVYWLRDVKEPVLPTVSEEDVRIVHKRDEDMIWFYSTTLGVPALVLLTGFVGVKRRRRTR